VLAYLCVQTSITMHTPEGFEGLSPQDWSALLLAPVQIVALIAGADGLIDRAERYWSERLVRVRTYARPSALNAYYQAVSNGFTEKLDALMAQLPADTAARSATLARALTDLNPVLSALEPGLGASLYKGYLGLAKEAAAASGGFLRIGAVSAAEYKWVGLPMLTPIAMPAGEAEDQGDWDGE
jgi:hypothetical protein